MDFSGVRKQDGFEEHIKGNQKKFNFLATDRVSSFMGVESIL